MKKLLLTLLFLCIMTAPALASVETGRSVAVAAAEVSVNLNQAGIVDLQTLPGIGPALAERIVAYRDEHGPFQSVDQLTNVKGIGAKKLEKFRDNLTLK